MMPDRRKVIHIITRLDKGGAAENTLLTVLGMDKKKYDVQLVKGPTYESRMSRDEQASVIADQEKARSDGVKLVTCPFMVRRINLVYDVLTLIALTLFLVKERPAVVHTHTSKAGLLGRFAARLARVPHIVHTPHGHVFWGYFSPWKTRMFILLERLSMRITDKIIALTNREKDDYLFYKIAQAEKILVINSGVDLGSIEDLPLKDRRTLKQELGIPEGRLIVGTAGRLEPVKGPEHLVEAARYVLSARPDVFFVFAGDGELKSYLARRASELGIAGDVLFLGWRKDVTRVISVYDIFVLPSLNEGMGRVLVEAMALGKPIVASDAGGIPDLVTHGKNGFLVPPNNPKRLAECIQILLRNKEQRAKMGAEGKVLSRKYDKDIMVENIAKLYDDLLTKYSLNA